MAETFPPARAAVAALLIGAISAAAGLASTPAVAAAPPAGTSQATASSNGASAAAIPSPDAAASGPSTVKFKAPTAVPTAADPALEARMLAITSELRCLVCQNQTIADSHADLAVDLRQEVRELLKRGQSDAQVRRYMTDRYGDFVLYRPPLKPTTLVLWLGPALLLAIALIALIVVIARRGKLADDRFEPDPVWDDDLEPPRSANHSADTAARPGAPA